MSRFGIVHVSTHSEKFPLLRRLLRRSLAVRSMTYADFFTCVSKAVAASRTTSSTSYMRFPHQLVVRVTRAEPIPPSYFTNSATDTANTDLSDLVHGLDVAGFGTFPSASALEKRPSASSHRRIRDDPAFTAKLPAPPIPIRSVYKGIGGTTHFGSEVTWSGIVSWVSRVTGGRGINADFFVAHLVPSALFLLKSILKEESSSSV
ncbi:hypothetical protein EDB84DRAFT_641829 [Lactarius hengduanensis]|nr:hypothetical protein EDB84DRAFT_641829 [Lactarius hengduanensis]